MFLCKQTGVMLLPIDSVLNDKREFISHPRSYAILYSNSHAYAYIPNGKSDKDLPNSSVLINAL